MTQVEIKTRENGPYKVTGPIRLIDAEPEWLLPHVFDHEPDVPPAGHVVLSPAELANVRPPAASQVEWNAYQALHGAASVAHC